MSRSLLLDVRKVFRGGRRKQAPLLAGATLVGLLFAVTPAAAQTGNITGTVSDVATRQMLESAIVRLDDAEGGVLTNASGRYVIVGVPAGTHQLTFEILGYGSQTLQVEVPAGGAVELNAELTGQALKLQELVVTGVARQAVGTLP